MPPRAAAPVRLPARLSGRPAASVALVLIGFMGTGKTTVGRELAAAVGRPFHDTDALVEQALGLPVREIFPRLGEAAFRAAEREAVARAAAVPGAIIATGGGAVTEPANLAGLQRAGVLACLTARPERILARVGPAEDRPLLAGRADLPAAVAELLEQRAARYAVADYHLDTSDLSVPQVISALCNAFPFLCPEPTTKS